LSSAIIGALGEKIKDERERKREKEERAGTKVAEG